LLAVSLFPTKRDHSEKAASTSQEEAPTRNQISQHLNLGLASLQNYEK
jgi:hypothetical protein